MTYDVAAVRARYPALSDGRVWADGAAGTQLPSAVIEAMAQVYRHGVSNQGAAFAASRRSGDMVAGARSAVADLVGAPDPTGVVLGPSMTALTYRFAAALSAGWPAGSEVVLSELDHDANIRPWIQAASAVGARVRIAPIDPATGALPATTVTDLINGATRLVAVTAASNLLGTLTDVPAITAAARAVGAVSYVDGVHHCPHAVVDVTALGADLYVVSAHKWSGPPLAAAVAADAAMLATVAADNLLPAPDRVPERFELGTNQFAALAGVTAAVDHLAGLPGLVGPAGPADAACETAIGSPIDNRRARLVAVQAAVVGHEQRLGAVLADGLRTMRHVRLLGPSAGEPRTPVASFLVTGLSPTEVAVELDEAGINVTHGHGYAWEAAGRLGIRQSGGAVRVSLSLYNDASDVDRVLQAVADLRCG